VKTSFREYLEGIEDSATTVDGGASLAEDGTLVFPLRGGGAPTPPRELEFDGSVLMTAYRGVLTVRLRDVRVRIDADGSGALSAMHPAAPRPTDLRADVVTFDASVTSGSHILVPVPLLTDTGVRMLGDVYAVGSAVDPIEIELGP
jgi:hypothetical protein